MFEAADGGWSHPHTLLTDERKSAFTAMSEHQKVFSAHFKGKQVKMIIATVGVQIFDMKRRLVNTLLFTDMPKWTTGKTTRRDGSAAHCVRVFMSHEALGIVERRIEGEYTRAILSLHLTPLFFV
jgi:hypothetical protein